MADFWTTTRQRSRLDRKCPECSETIRAGDVYVREAGACDGDFFSGFMCEPCRAFADRYLNTLRLSECVNPDEVTYCFGEMLCEAAEFIGYRWSEGHDALTPAARREAMLPLLDEIDEAERKERERVRNLRKASTPPRSLTHTQGIA